MDYAEFMLKNSPNTSSRRIEISKGYAVFRCKDDKIAFKTIRDMLHFLCAVRLKYRFPVPICFNLEMVPFLDKLTILMFECVCYILITEWHHRVRITGLKSYHGIIADGARSSPLQLLTTSKENSQSKFQHRFKSDIYQNHYRKFIPADAAYDTALSVIMQDLDSFLRNLNVKQDYRRDITNVIVELIGNACEHGNADSLIDIDVTGLYKNKMKDGDFRGLNFAMVSLSEIPFGHDLQEKINQLSYDACNERYAYVKKAYENHGKFFSDSYTPLDFFRIAAFQHHISGRKSNGFSGGTGLTKLIRSLEDMADAHNCYMITESRSIWFYRDFLEYNSENWIGFNHERSLMDAPPDDKVLSGSDLYVPGTAFNLCFIMKEDNEDE